MQAWGLDATGLTPELEGQIRLAIVRLQTAPSRNKKEEKLPRDPCLTEIANIAKQIEHPCPPHFAGLAAFRGTTTPLHQNEMRAYNQTQYSYRFGSNAARVERPAAKLEWIDWIKPLKHLGQIYLNTRRGSAAKALLAAGCHPASFYSTKLDGSDWPHPLSCPQIVAKLIPHASHDACTSMFNAFDSKAPDKSAFRTAAAECARQSISNIWLERAGIANASEKNAVSICAFFIERLKKKKSLPADLEEIRDKVMAKISTLKNGDSQDEFLFTENQHRRMKHLLAASSGDDLEVFAALTPLCGLDSPAAFQAGVPVGVIEWQRGRYWTNNLAYQDKFLCAAHLLDHGENPWLCAGDGIHGVEAQGNPYSWIALASNEKNNFGLFAMAWAKACLRDAELRAPGQGLEYCLEAFEDSRNSRKKLWSEAKTSAALAACEATLIPTMIAIERMGEPNDGPSAPSKRFSRL